MMSIMADLGPEDAKIMIEGLKEIDRQNNKHRRETMDLLTYSSNEDSPLNQARLQLWCAKELLAEANRRNDNEMRGRAMGYINKDRTALRELAYALRAKLPARKLYRVPMKSKETGKVAFIIFERAHFNGQACVQAEDNYPHFTADVPEELSA